MIPKLKILYFYTNWSSFVEKDVTILQSKHEVKLFEFKSSKKIYTPIAFLKQTVFILKNYRKPSGFVVQFSGYHAFLPCLFAKIFKAPSIIIAGGTDCVAFPSIKYGNLRNNLLGKFTRWSYQLAKHISPVDESLVYYKYNYQNNDFLEQGIKAFIPDLKVPITVIHNGYDNTFYPKKDIQKQNNLFISVAAGITEKSRFDLKGMDLIFQMAHHIPEAKFIIIGSKTVPEKIPENVKLLPFVPNKELINYYNQASFYLQLSMSEGFPNSLSEAMQCGCVPIVSATGAMPFIIENTGFVLKTKNLNDLIQLVQKAINSDIDALGKLASERININFTLKNRENKLLNLVEEQFKLY